MWLNVKQKGHVWWFINRNTYSNLSKSSFLNKTSTTTDRKSWETSGKSIRIGPDILGEWQ
jgi:hypothetical protein